MKKFKILIALAIIAATVSCSKKDFIEPPTQGATSVFIRVQSVDVDGKGESYSRTLVIKN